MKKQPGIIYIGTSNVVVPGNKSSFPVAFQSASRLHYYSHLFNSVEVNSSFYKIPMRSTYQKWADDVTDNFRFTIKLFRDITHHKTLRPDYSLITKFLSAANGLGSKKGCLLIQFPGKITLDYYNEVEEILKVLEAQDKDMTWRKAIEFRHPSWYIGEMYELLSAYNITPVLHDKAKGKMIDIAVTTDFVYVRYHGPTGNYRETYSEHFLHQQAERINNWRQEGKDVYAYFNNTIGNAFENAKFLQAILT